MSSSSERPPAQGAVRALSTPELRHGEWTRAGGTAILGDEATESMLGRLAAETRRSATAQGYAVGWAQGRRDAAEAAASAEAERVAAAAEAETRRAAEHRAAVAALTEAAAGVRAGLDALAADLGAQATDLAWLAVEELLAHQLRLEGAPDVIGRVLAVLPPTPVATVRVHPDVAATVAADDLGARGVAVVADADLGAADALVAVDGAVVDLRIDAARARIRAALDGACTTGAAGER